MIMNVPTYIVEGNVPILLGSNTMKRWDSKLNFKNETLEVYLYDEKNPLEFLAPKIGSHYKMKLEKLKKWNLEETVNYLEEEVHLISEDEKKRMTEYKNIKKVHEVTNHKSAENLIHAYANAEIIDEKVRKNARLVVERCKICKKNKRSRSRPSVALPKVVDFNQIVTYDLKKWGPKQILWMICSFTRFLKGVVWDNKEGPTVIKALHSEWI